MSQTCECGGAVSSEAQQPAQPRPVFIVGAARSGTTLLQQMLDHHPNLMFPWESFFIPVFAKRLQKYGDLAVVANRLRLIRDIEHFLRGFYPKADKKDWCPGLDEAAAELAAASAPDYASIVDTIFRFCTRRRAAVRWCDKTPLYVNHMPTLLNLFPDARFVHIYRDGRDMAASIIPLPFGANSTYVAAEKWLIAVRNAMALEKRTPGAILHVRYEDLIADPEPVLRRVCAFIGEPYVPEMLTFHTDSLHRVPDAGLHHRLGKPVNAQAVARWKTDLSPRQVELYESVAGDMLRRLGYELSGPVKRRRKKIDRWMGRGVHYMRAFLPFLNPYSSFSRFERAIARGWFH